MNPKHRVVVGLSGGVDSAVAALLLKDQGHRVEALFMKNWDEDDEAGYCPAAEDLEDAKAVCELLGIRLHTVSFSTEYWDRVFTAFLEEYRAGRTPNPDVLCNREIKFRAFLDYATTLGAQRIATGHYARIREVDGAWQLLSGSDAAKDQSYFLHLLDQRQLARSLFPLGELKKSEVRRLAAEAGFPNHEKKDSTGICFIGERRFRDFLSRYLPAQPGEIRTLDDGEAIGTHGGIAFYTLGQRQGLGIGGVVTGSGEPWYVAEKDASRNILYVVQGDDHPALFRDGLHTGPVHWISGQVPPMPLPCLARVRYRQAVQPCTLAGRNNGSVSAFFDSPQRAVTPGQSAVFYRGDECLGGGVIESTFNAVRTDRPDDIARTGSQS